jgi:hypothetical protein
MTCSHRPSTSSPPLAVVEELHHPRYDHDCHDKKHRVWVTGMVGAMARVGDGAVPSQHLEHPQFTLWESV